MNDDNTDIERLLSERGENLRSRPGLTARVYAASAPSLGAGAVVGRVGSRRPLVMKLAIAAALAISAAGLMFLLFTPPAAPLDAAPGTVAATESAGASDEVVVALLAGSETADLATDVPLDGLLEVRDMGVQDVHSEVMLVLATASMGGTP